MKSDIRIIFEDLDTVIAEANSLKELVRLGCHKTAWQSADAIECAGLNLKIAIRKFSPQSFKHATEHLRAATPSPSGRGQGEGSSHSPLTTSHPSS